MINTVPLSILKANLIGNHFSHVSIGDQWTLHFDTFWLVSQDIESSEEVGIATLLACATPFVLDAVDKETIPKAVIVLRNMRKKVSGLILHGDGSLELEFDEGRKFILPTSTDVVDWHWALNKTGKDPYHEFLVACFVPGTVETHDNGYLDRE